MPCTDPVRFPCDLTAMISSVSANYSKKKMTNEEKKVVVVVMFLSFVFETVENDSSSS